MNLINNVTTSIVGNLIHKIKHSILPIRISLRIKMLILAALVFAGFGIVFVQGTFLVKDVKIGSERYVKIRNYQRALVKIESLKSDFNQIRVEYLTLVEESNPEIQKQGMQAIDLLNKRVNQSFEEILLAIPKENQKPFADARDEWQVFNDNMTGKIIPVILEGNKELALERLQSIQRYRYNRVVFSLKSAAKVLNVLTNELEQSTNFYINKRIITIIVSSSLIFLVILVTSLIISTLIVRPLHRAVRFAQDVSSGDLTRELHEPIRDEVGVLAANLNVMVSGLVKLVENIFVASSKLSDVSRTVSRSSEQVTNETRVQMASIEQSCAAIIKINHSTQSILGDVTNLSISNESTHSSVNEMVASTSEIVGYSELLTNLAEGVGKSISSIDNSIQTLDKSIENLSVEASETSSSIALLEDSALEIHQKSLTTLELADQASKFVASGKDAVNATIESMREIRNSSKTAHDVIKDLSTSVEDIGVILTVIEDINDKISLLALNARIISAKAGESGMAFGVVASEFKSLSKQTADSTLEIAKKIERVQSQTKKAVEAIRKTESVVAQGENLSRISGTALGEIVTVVRQTSQEMHSISNSIEKQKLGSTQIAGAVKKTSTSINQIAKASHELKHESRLIILNSEQMTIMSENVTRSIKENESAAQHVSRASENITLMIEHIKTSCEAETTESYRVQKAMEDINATLARNLESAQSASNASNMLIHQVEFLNSAVTQFKRNDSTTKSSQASDKLQTALTFNPETIEC